MSTTCPTCGGDGELDTADESASWTGARSSGGVTDDGERYRIEWRSSHVVKRALFRVSTDDRVCVLQHIRTIFVRQHGATRCEIDDDATLDDVPAPFLAAMEADGFQPAAGVSDFA
jgi:hypothetical protein